MFAYLWEFYQTSMQLEALVLTGEFLFQPGQNKLTGIFMVEANSQELIVVTDCRKPSSAI